MAARIPLILSQPARRDAEAIDLIENIVAAAMLVPGLDANLVGDIGSFELGGTDHLCLIGHTRDIVLASFLDLADAQAAWQRLGQLGHFVDFASDEEAIRNSLPASPGVRRVFYYRLKLGLPVAGLLDQCAKLLAAQQLNLVTIRLGPASPAPSRPAPLPVVPRIVPPAITVPVRSSPPAGDAPQPASIGPLFPKPEVHARGQVEDDDRQWSELDKLVDDLGAMDL